MKRPSLNVGEGPTAVPTARMPLTVSVVICAYTEDRWPLLQQSVASVQRQSRIPVEIIVCVDHNESLLERCRRQWADQAEISPGGGACQPVRGSSRFGSKLRR